MAEKDSGCFSPAAATRAKILTSSDSDNRRCQPLTPSFSRCFSHSPYSYLLAVLILSATIWLCLAEWVMGSRRHKTVLLVDKLRLLNVEPYWIGEPHPAPADRAAKLAHAHTYLAFTWILGDWVGSTWFINGSSSGVNAPVSHWIIWTFRLRCIGMHLVILTNQA